MPKPVDGPGLAMVAVGGALIYAGVKGYSLLQLAQNLITGKPILTNTVVVNPITRAGIDTSDDKVGQSGTSDDTPTPAGGNKGLGQQMAAAMGWTGSEWAALDKLWTKESGWRNTADNPSSHAYGIPQALPYTKMPRAAWPSSAGGQSDARTQISWGLNYIRQRYGRPTLAWAHSQATDWY